MIQALDLKWLGHIDYSTLLTAMQRQSLQRAQGKVGDEVWFCEHPPIYTTGKRGINNSVSQLKAPLLTTERGGETTFHGPGQLMMYPILSLKTYQLSIRGYVSLLEQSCINTLAILGIQAGRNCKFPGVWVDDTKIAAIGLRIHQGVASHGMALNVSTDLSWFDAINPCGTSHKMSSISTWDVNAIPLENLPWIWFTQLKILLVQA